MVKFDLIRFSDRFEPIECHVQVYREPYVCPKREPMGSAMPYRGTGAAIVLPDGRYWIGVCLCSKDDPFEFSAGRQRAIGRAFQAMRASTNDPFPLRASTEKMMAAVVLTLKEAIQSKKEEVDTANFRYSQ